MGSVKYFCLGIYLVLGLRVGRVGLAGRGGCWTRERLHFGGWGGERRANVGPSVARRRSSPSQHPCPPISPRISHIWAKVANLGISSK